MNRHLLSMRLLLLGRLSMPTLLHLDSSPMGDHSVSRHMSATFAERWLIRAQKLSRAT
jgi:hypothetical protein